MNILGIESTCDETACSVVRNGREILSNIIYSQSDLHSQWGGVIPEIACRNHVEALLEVAEKALKEANLTLDQIDLIAVANGPGLIGALMIGVMGAKALSLACNKPLIGINHIEAHLYAAIMSHEEPVQFPAIGAILSGGHTTLVVMDSIGSYRLISQTVDDAIGEAFDKVAKILNLPYPGGPHIERLAKKGSHENFSFKAGNVKGKPLEFSFSGLKTAVLYAARGQNNHSSKETIEEKRAEDIAAAFQKAAFDDVIGKIKKSASLHGCRTVVLGGGVTNNQELKKQFAIQAPELNVLWPKGILSLDNGAMIAGLAYHQYLKKGADTLDLDAHCSLKI